MTPKLHHKLLVLCAVVLLCCGANACGTSNPSHTASRASETAANEGASGSAQTKLDADRDTDGAHPDEDEKARPGPPDKDNDADNTGRTRYDSDDSTVLDFGHAASRADRTAIAALIKRYYAISATENGAGACSMLYSTYAEALPEDYGTSPPGPAYARGATCAAVMNRVLEHFHSQIVARLPKLKVIRVRIKARQGVAVLSFGALSEREMHVVREGHIWKMLALTDTELP